MIETFYQFLGQLVVSLLILIAILIAIVLILGLILLKKNILIFPKTIVFLIDLLYTPIKKVLKIFKKDETIVDTIGIEARNRVNKEKFSEIPAEETLIFLPHCLRHRDCEALLQETGLICTECGKCSIGAIQKKGIELGYKIYIVPGSSFVKKIAKEKKFKSVIGVACKSDLNQIMMLLSDFHPQGALLKTTGCFETKVDMKSLLKIMNSKK
ncbi:MAG: DUF116 domain-containing protein [Methanobrevibacter sp.]|uniref:DUF116 domain-containing protein n=1 Tax=Methanobrevibacter sp. TaxID=66852 RepID=UPI0026E042D2|nr:DUF116 domain-containing protein [Methanobrevibacter sp.]MDO5849125.1 DUF116 domain-containing protein [Methanobrevibacter sp.]